MLPQLVTKYIAYYGNRSYITVLRTARRLLVPSPFHHYVVYPKDMDVGDDLLKGVSCTTGNQQRIFLHIGFRRGAINPSPLEST